MIFLSGGDIVNGNAPRDRLLYRGEMGVQSFLSV